MSCKEKREHGRQFNKVVHSFTSAQLREQEHLLLFCIGPLFYFFYIVQREVGAKFVNEVTFQ